MAKAGIRRNRPGWYGEPARHREAALGRTTDSRVVVFPHLQKMPRTEWPPDRTRFPKKGAYRVFYRETATWGNDDDIEHQDVDAANKKEAAKAVKKYYTEKVPRITPFGIHRVIIVDVDAVPVTDKPSPEGWGGALELAIDDKGNIIR